jgi:hypothetical protein
VEDAAGLAWKSVEFVAETNWKVMQSRTRRVNAMMERKRADRELYLFVRTEYDATDVAASHGRITRDSSQFQIELHCR